MASFFLGVLACISTKMFVAQNKGCYGRTPQVKSQLPAVLQFYLLMSSADSAEDESGSVIIQQPGLLRVASGKLSKIVWICGQNKSVSVSIPISLRQPRREGRAEFRPAVRRTTSSPIPRSDPSRTGPLLCKR